MDYYAQRVSAGGLIIAEVVAVSPQAHQLPATPGIYTAEQAPAWKDVTNAVRGKGGRIFLQLGHAGRESHSSLQPNGQAPVAPPALAGARNVFTSDFDKVRPTQSQALDVNEIAGIIDDFTLATHAG